MIEEYVTFKTSRGFKLAGVLFAPNAGLNDVVVFAHGTGSSKASPRNRMIANRLLSDGIASLLFDFTGHGESDGIFEQSTPDQQYDDIISALDWLNEQAIIETQFIGVNGSSTGGTAAIRAAAEDSRVQVMVLRVPRNYNVLDYAMQIKAPTLILQGSEDSIVLPEAKDIYMALPCPKELHIIKGAGHLFDEKPQYIRKMVDVTCKWFEDWFSKFSEE